jgi:hypothetical protein
MKVELVGIVVRMVNMHSFEWQTQRHYAESALCLGCFLTFVCRDST